MVITLRLRQCPQEGSRRRAFRACLDDEYLIILAVRSNVAEIAQTELAVERLSES